MSEKINRLPILALIAISALGLLTFSILQSTERKDKQEAAAQALQREHDATEATMKAIGERAAEAEEAATAAREKAYQETPQAIELQRLEAEDRAATALPRSNPPR
jgi:hypothetical protein